MAHECLQLHQISADMYTLGLSTATLAHGSYPLIKRILVVMYMGGSRVYIYMVMLGPAFATSASELTPISDVLVVSGGRIAMPELQGRGPILSY